MLSWGFTMELLDILFDSSSLQIDSIEVEENVLVFKASTKQKEAFCPACTFSATHVHSYYKRHPADLPCLDYLVRLELSTCRFFCHNPECSKQTFAEKFPDFLEPHARRTERLLENQLQAAFFLSAEAASRLLKQLKMPSSPDTLLRIIRRSPEIDKEKARVIGVDDWAFLKGQTYGTILVNLETHEVMELLDERSADSFAAWLEENPGVEIISRDRGKEYIKGATEGAPDAIQVADRWHLLKNLREALQRFLEKKKSFLQKAAKAEKVLQEKKKVEEAPIAKENPLPPKEEQNSSYERRKARFEAVKELDQKGVSKRAIARELGISRNTVKKYVHLEECPSYPKVKKKANKLGPYLDELQKLWEQGVNNGAQLYERVKELGFSGVQRTIERWASRQKKNGAPKEQNPTPEKVIPWSPRRGAWLLTKQESELDSDEQKLLQELIQNDQNAKEAHRLGQEFQEMVRERKVELLEDWFKTVQESGISALQSFMNGLKQDLAAVKAALSLPWSNGQTEGQVNRLKFIKRQMYGRANFDLLRRKVLAQT